MPVNPSVRVIVLQRSDHQPAQLGPWRYWVWCNAHRTPLRVKGLGRSDTPTSLGGRRTRAPRRHKREPSTRSAVSSMLVFGKCRTVRGPWRAGGTSPAVVRSCCYPSGRGREVRRTPGAKPVPPCRSPASTLGTPTASPGPMGTTDPERHRADFAVGDRKPSGSVESEHRNGRGADLPPLCRSAPRPRSRRAAGSPWFSCRRPW